MFNYREARLLDNVAIVIKLYHLQQSWRCINSVTDSRQSR